MRCDVRAKKGTGLDDLFKGYAPQQLEETKPVQKVSDSILEILLQKYACVQEKFIQKNSGGRPLPFTSEFELADEFNAVEEVVPPSVITAFAFCETEKEEDDHPWMQNFLGAFITKLIQNSYDAGFNNFYLDRSDRPLYSLGCFGINFQGKAEKPLAITVDGNVDNHSLCNAHHVAAKISGASGIEFALHIKNCNLDIGSVETTTAFYEAEDCNLIIRERTLLPFCFNAKRVTVVVEGDAVWLEEEMFAQYDQCAFTFGKVSPASVYAWDIKKDDLELKARESTFATSDRQFFDALLYAVPRGNKIVYLNPQGQEVEEKMHHALQRVNYHFKRLLKKL